MVALLDVNVLVALFDPEHIQHDAAHKWFARNRKRGWATCPLTENGLVRVLSNPSYPGGRTTISDAVQRLGVFRGSGFHDFWPDSASLCEEALFNCKHIRGHQKVTDAYLLALAVLNGGRLATFDKNIPLAAAAGSEPGNLVLLGRDD